MTLCLINCVTDNCIMANKRPALQFYPGDWFRDCGVQLLTFEERGVWFELLLRMHDSQDYGALTVNGIAMTDEEIGRLIGYQDESGNPSKIKQTLANLLSKGVASRRQIDGALCNRRMLKYNEISIMRSAIGRKGGLAKAEQLELAKAASSSSSSSSSSEELRNSSPCTPEQIMELWNKNGLPPCKKLGSTIRKKIEARIKEHPDEEWWVKLFDRVKESDLLAGRKGDWCATLDWVCGPKNLDKIELGNYDKRTTTLKSSRPTSVVI